MKKIVFILLLLTVTMRGFAQSELTMPFLGNIFQNTYLNPAMQTENEISIGLPGLSSIQFQVIHNGFVPSKVMSISGNTLQISANDLLDQLRNQNLLYANTSIDLLHVKVRYQNWDIWYGLRQNQQISLFYPKSLINLALFGNEQFKDTPMDLTPLGFNGSMYQEHTIGASKEMGKWVFGGRISLLHGITNAYLKPNNITLSVTDDMYSMSANADATIKTSGIPDVSLDNINFNQFGVFNKTDISSLSNFGEYVKSNYASNFFSKFKNPGFALSAGALYKYDPRLTLSFAISDLGFISWSNNNKFFSIKGETEFQGADRLEGMLNGDEFTADSLLNDFTSNFETDEDQQGRYATWLHTKFYLSGTYQVAQRTHLNASLYGVVNRTLYPALTLGVNQGVGRLLNVSLTTSMNQRKLSNIGFGLLFKPGPFQFYLAADNINSPLFNPLSFTNMNVRMGINLVFGGGRKL